MKISKLIDKAVEKAGSQQDLAKLLKIKYITRFGDYKAGRRKPDDALVGMLAEFVGMNPIDTILACREETDKENATLWAKWRSQIEWHPVGDSNPCYRRERAGILAKVWQCVKTACQVIGAKVGITLGCLYVTVTQKLHDMIQGYALLHKKRRKRMPQIMNTNMTKTSHISGFFKAFF